MFAGAFGSVHSVERSLASYSQPNYMIGPLKKLQSQGTASLFGIDIILYVTTERLFLQTKQIVRGLRSCMCTYNVMCIKAQASVATASRLGSSWPVRRTSPVVQSTIYRLHFRMY